MGRQRCLNSQETLSGQAEDGEATVWTGSQHLRGEGVEPLCAQRLRAGNAPAAEGSRSWQVPCRCGGRLGALQAPSPGLFLASSREGRQARSWQMEGMKLLQEVLGRHQKAHCQECDRWGKNEGRDE